MKYLIALLVLTLFAPATTMAANNNNAVCQTLVNHKPIAGVTHQPGVDVKGNAVTPADVNGAQFKVPEIIKVPLTIDLAKRVAALTGTGIQMDGNMGMLEIHDDGKVMYNNQDWTSPVNTLCGRSHKQVEEVIVDAPAAEVKVEAPKAPETPAKPEKMVRKTRTIASTSAMNPMMKPRDTISKPADIHAATVRPAAEPSVQRVSKPDLKMIEQPKPIEVEAKVALPPKDESRVIFNDPNNADVNDSDRIDGGGYR